ncbi:hypothetical protein [Herbaspirillum sp. alder98]|uniref:hypothetical protein n=1 Tax=Herbaspirillum sp. alder98 TaxID=2913096 RepID=UPI001CD8EBB4|nr:hypothetical protein [Herbaspirillum sp. alder98]MCA1325399.1 hypothetical protein [Herbaspirillum sp. alder98]
MSWRFFVVGEKSCRAWSDPARRQAMVRLGLAQHVYRHAGNEALADESIRCRHAKKRPDPNSGDGYAFRINSKNLLLNRDWNIRARGNRGRTQERTWLQANFVIFHDSDAVDVVSFCLQATPQARPFYSLMVNQSKEKRCVPRYKSARSFALPDLVLVG